MNGLKEVRHACAVLFWAPWHLVGSKGVGRGVGMRPQLCFRHSRPAFMCFIYKSWSDIYFEHSSMGSLLSVCEFSLSRSPVFGAAGRNRQKMHLCLTQPICDTVADASFPRPLILFLVPVPGRMLPLMMTVLILLLLPMGQAAPKDGVTRPDSEVQHQLLPNPFQPGQEQLGLLQSYLKGLGRTEVQLEHLSREQVLLYLFALHDYDQSGQLDGLELLSMLTAALAPGVANSPTTNPVILIVDKVLETQDLNGDGLMTPAELINFPGVAPRHVEPGEPLAPSPQEPQAVGRQSLLAKSPLRQETQEAPGPREEAKGQVEARRESLDPVQEPGGQAEADGDVPGPRGEAEGQAEAKGDAPGPRGEAGVQAEAEGDAPGPRGEAGGQAEAEGDAPGPRGEAGGQAEARENGEEAKELPGETLESKNTQNEFEVHIVQVENDEI
ncbi:CGREF1 isoform 7 [Pan troglodytes]|uniref:Cell growth regulator with EF hand domain protein 1 n=4 Tax=Pan troglodytes TaxID=9598 RepID=A0A2I3SM22_PANTR|nr:CGREF1 isoform 7 [Pan troglodytes]